MTVGEYINQLKETIEMLETLDINGIIEVSFDQDNHIEYFVTSWEN